jgi:two-component system sporulation sensor kinase A
VSPERERNPVLTVLERLPIAVVISDLASGTVLWASTRDPNVAGGLTADQVVGRCLLDFIDPSQQERALHDLQLVAAGQSPPPVNYRIHHPGSGVAHAQIASVPSTYEGRPAVLSLVTNVTELVRARQELEEVQERYRQLVETSPDGIVVVGPGGVDYVNQTLVRALGATSPDELIGQSVYSFIHPDYHDASREARRQVIRYGKNLPPRPITLVRLDGAYITTTVQTTRIHWNGEYATQTIMRDLVTAVPETLET